MKITNEPQCECGGQCPSQFEFQIDDKYNAYVRYRHGRLYLELVTEIDSKKVLSEIIYEEYFGGHHDGTINWSDVKHRIENLNAEELREKRKKRKRRT